MKNFNKGTPINDFTKKVMSEELKTTDKVRIMNSIHNEILKKPGAYLKCSDALCSNNAKPQTKSGFRIEIQVKYLHNFFIISKVLTQNPKKNFAKSSLKQSTFKETYNNLNEEEEKITKKYQIRIKNPSIPLTHFHKTSTQKK